VVGVDPRTAAGRLGHSEGSTTLNFDAQFAQPANQLAATIVSGQLAELRKKERQVLFVGLGSGENVARPGPKRQTDHDASRSATAVAI